MKIKFKNKVQLIIVICVAVALVLGGVGTAVYFTVFAKEANSLAFANDEFTVYLSEGDTYTPEVVSKPKMAEYVLSVSNNTIASVNDDGVSIKLIRSGIVTLTATSGELSATQTLKVLSQKPTSQQESDNGQDGVIASECYTVVFISEWGGAEDQVVKPGETAVEPTMPETMNGKMFGYWYVKGTTEPYDFSTPVTSNLVLLANWITITQPAFNYGLYNGGVYITGLYYAYIHYTTINFPSTVPDETFVKSQDISGRTIAGIYENAFKDNEYLTEVSLPASYTLIYEGAFSGCTALKTVKFATSGCTEIRDEAFKSATALESCILPESLTTLGSSVFANCTKLTDIGTLPMGISTLNNFVFANTGITSIDISNVKTLGARVFESCTSLATVLGGDALESVDSYTFKNTAYLTNALANSTDGTVYLGDILLYYYPKKNVFTVNIKASTRLIAGCAISDGISKDTTFVFTAETAPKREQYGIYSGSENIELIVPDAYYYNYYTAWSENRSQLYHEDTTPEGLTLRVRNNYTDGTVTSYSVAIMKYLGTAETLDVKSILDATYATDGRTYSVLRVNTIAFYGLTNGKQNSLYSNLKKIILPVCISSFEMNCISWLGSLDTIEFVGSESDYPSSVTVATSAIANIYCNTFHIVVPSALLTKYEALFPKLDVSTAK